MEVLYFPKLKVTKSQCSPQDCLRRSCDFINKNKVLHLEVVWVQLDPWQYQAGTANMLGANEISACDGVRVSNFCQRSPFAMHSLTGLPNAFGAHGISACDGVRVGIFYLQVACLQYRP